MQARSSSGKRTFTETARRAQIVDAAIEVVAEHGYPNTSFAKIAKQAGLSSTGMISYHFQGKDDLIRAVVAEIVRVNTEFVAAKLDPEAGYAAPQMFGLIELHLELTRDQERWIREGQRAGAFRDFDPAIMVMAIQGAREAAIARARVDPDFDTAACARELADLFDHATRQQP